MLISQIITLAELQSDETYPMQEWVDLYNMCQDDLTPIAKMVTTVFGIDVEVENGKAVIEVAENEELASAHKIIDAYYTPLGGKRIKLRRLQYEDTLSKGWKIAPAYIHLQGLGNETDGSIDISYYKRLEHCVYDEELGTYTPDEPEIPEEYHPLYVSYLCYRSQQREEEPNDEARFRQEYQTLKEVFAITRITHIEPWKARDLQQTGGE